MPARPNSTRNRLIQAALELFIARGITETTTKTVADRAKVNEVTLFRHFGNKHGLLLAVLAETDVLSQLGQQLVEQAPDCGTLEETLREGVKCRLQMLDRAPELVRSLIGEGGQFSVEIRQALGEGLTTANEYVARYLAQAIERAGGRTTLPPEALAGLFESLLLGYFAIEITSEGRELWQGREEAIAHIVQLLLNGAVALPSDGGNEEAVADLPGSLVREILQRAKKSSRNDYAWVYVLFGAGLSAEEVVNLARSQSVQESNQHLLQITQGKARQVPLNQWILDKRYGSSSNNPLTQWLKQRKDSESALFLNGEGKPLKEEELRQTWEALTEGLMVPQGHPPRVEQARDTWCVAMLTKGMDVENLSLLSGMEIEQLQPYARRAREKAAIEQAARLDRATNDGN
ncbi:MAG: TetR family transcriptional regulator [Cyanobacteriota bacterium]|nr:TetR family transcriptional regulator [Cyanobacteriota bacterium]